MSQVLRIRNWLSSLKRSLLRDWVAQDLRSHAARKGLRLEKLEDRELMAVAVSSFSPTPSGFIAQFSEEIRVANLNLFDAQNGALGAADVTLRGNSTGDIKGSLVLNGTSLSFVATGGALAPDTYTAVLKSGVNAIVDAAAGQLLDGENNGTLPSGNGTAGGDFSSTFTVTSSPLVVSLPDFARGPSQTVNVPAVGSGQSPQTGLPIRLSNAQGVTSLTLTLAYDSSLLTVSEVKLGRNAPSGSQIQSNLTVPGQATISFFALDPLASDAADIIELVATVPAGATYGKSQVVRLQNLEVNAGALQARADDAIHVVAFPGDANGNRRYDAEDARLIARVGVGLDSGFVLADPSGTVNSSAARIFPSTDPLIIGDVTGRDGLSPLDGSDVLRRVAGLPTLNIPSIQSSQAPTALSISSSTVSDSVSIGAAIGTFTTTDADVGDTFTYSLVSGTGATDNASFTIVGNQLRTAITLNAGTKSSFSVRVQTTDSTGNTFQQIIAITVSSSNRAPTSVSLNNATVAESASIGTAIGSLSAVDPDSGDTHTYTLVTGTGATDNASFSIVGASLRTAITLNAEAKSSYTVRVRATDAAGLFVESAFTITVNNVNESPTSLALNNASVTESASIGTSIGTLSTVDPDAGDTHTYTFVTGTGSTDNASFSIVGTSLRTATTLNAATKSSYTVRVRSTDAAGLFVESVFAITVTNTNEAPTSIALSASSVAENATSGTTVGNLTTTDADVGDSHTYTLVSGTGSTDNASFTIVGGQLRTVSALNFETKSSYTVRVRSTDAGGLFVESAFTVTVTNVNESPVSLALSNATVSESASIGTAIGTLSTVDPDTGDTHTYTFVTGTGSTDNASFSIVGTSLRTATTLNAATKSSYTVRLRSTDAAGLFVESVFAITVTNTNEAPTSIALSASSVAENATSGTTVGNLTTTDADVGDTHTYTLVSGTGSTDNASFSIVGGQLQTSSALNFETKSSYTVRVRSTDTGGLFVESAFAIAVTNVNESPASLALSNASVAESASIGTAIGTLSSVDPDSGDTHTYTLVAGTGSTDNSSFSIVGTSLQTATTLNAVIKSSYTVRVRSTDAAGLFVESVFAIAITNENEAPTSLGLTSNTVAENATSGTVVGDLSTVDPDAGDSFVYTLVTGTGGDDNASFAIVGGQLQTASSFDFETKSSYLIRVRSTDAGGLFVDAPFVISVTNANEMPTAIDFSNNTIAENSASGTAVGTLSTTDVDSGDTHTYTFVAGTGDDDNAAFALAGNEIQILASPDFETKSSYSVRVRSTDANGLFFERVLNINVIDANENPTSVALSNATVNEVASIGTVIGSLSVADPDSGETHTYTLVAGTGDDDNASFSLAGSDLQTGTTLNAATKSTYTIRVRATDSGGLFVESVFVITVSNSNATPISIALGSNTVAENVTSGTTIGSFSTVDPDVGDFHSQSLVSGTGDDDNAAFAIVGGQLQTVSALDFETKSSYTVRVRSTDAGGLFAENVFVITVTNVNEAPTAIGLSNSTAVNNPASGTVVGQLSSTDPDAGDTQTYALVSGTGDTDNASFTIVGNELRTSGTLDFGLQSSYSVRVKSTDAGGLVVESVFVITETV